MYRTLKLLSILILIFVGAAPVLVAAQTSDDDLRSVIQNSVIADPRVANIPPAQLQGLVDALFAQAKAQHLSAADILWKPQGTESSTFGPGSSGAPACPVGWQGYLCNFNQIFGFEGNNYEIPIFMLVTSAFLIAVIWEIILHHRKKLAAAAGKVPLKMR